MTINISLDRSKLDTTVSYVEDLSRQSTSASGNSFLFPITIQTLDVPVVADVTDATWVVEAGTTTTVTVNAGDTSNIRVGDLAFGPNDTSATRTQGVDFGTGAYVSAVAAGTVDITLGGGNVTVGAGTNVAFETRPPLFDATIYILELEHTISGSNIRVTPKLHLFDGSLAADDPSASGYDGLLVANATNTVTFAQNTINADAFLTAARVPRTN